MRRAMILVLLVLVASVGFADEWTRTENIDLDRDEAWAAMLLDNEAGETLVVTTTTDGRSGHTYVDLYLDQPLLSRSRVESRMVSRQGEVTWIDVDGYAITNWGVRFFGDAAGIYAGMIAQRKKIAFRVVLADRSRHEVRFVLPADSEQVLWWVAMIDQRFLVAQANRGEE